MQSLPTCADYHTMQKSNEDKYLEMLKVADPELYMIKTALAETQINPMILPRFIRALYNLAVGTGYGKVTTHLSKGVVTAIKSEESDQIDYFVMEIKKTTLIDNHNG